MREIGVEEARKSLGDLVEEVATSREAVVITKHGAPRVAVIAFENSSLTMFAPGRGKIAKLNFATCAIELFDLPYLAAMDGQKLMEGMQWAFAQQLAPADEPSAELAPKPDPDYLLRGAAPTI